MMPRLPVGRRRNLLVIAGACVAVKLVSLAFISTAVGGSLLAQLSTKWDSVYYVDIARNGYVAGSVTANYAFAPGYPALIWLTNLVVGNLLISAAVVSNVFSVLAALAFYFVAERYFGATGALYSSLAFAFFPTFVTYGLVSYSEPVYLLFEILAVYYFLREKYLYTGVAASVAVLSSYINLLTAVLFISIFALKKLRAWRASPPPLSAAEQTARPGWSELVGGAWLFLPLATFAAWMYVLDARSGTLFSLLVAQRPWGTAVVDPVAQLQAFFTGIFSTQGNPVSQLAVRYSYTLPFFYLAVFLWKVDRWLTFYSSAVMLFVLSLIGTAYMSGPRLMLSAWPLLLVFGRAKKDLIVPVLVLFVAVSLQSTSAQLTSFWT